MFTPMKMLVPAISHSPICMKAGEKEFTVHPSVLAVKEPIWCSSIHQDVLSIVQYIWSTWNIYKCRCMQSFMPSCGLLQLVELFDLEIHLQTAKNMKLKEAYIVQTVVTGN